MTSVCTLALLASTAVLAMPKPERSFSSHQVNKSVQARLQLAQQELKFLGHKRVVLQRDIQRYLLDKTNTSSSVEANSVGETYEDYTQDMEALQMVFDEAFVTLDYAHYGADLGEPVIFTDPEQVIDDIRGELIAEYVVADTLRNMNKNKKHLQVFQEQKQNLQKEERDIGQRQNKSRMKLANLDLEIERKQQEVASLKTMMIRHEKDMKIVKRRHSEVATANVKVVLPRNDVGKGKKVASSDLLKKMDSKSALLFPVQGRIVMNFGDKDALGVKSRGLVLQADTGNDVVVPRAGVVRFAGPFGKFKQLLIVEHQGGYHSLITGLDVIDAKVGDHLSAGKRIGHLAATQAYYELRYNGVPVDPRKVVNSL